MINELTKEEHEFMGIFKRYSVKKDEVLLFGHIRINVYKLLSVPYRDKYREIMDSLISKGYTYKKNKNDMDLFLTEKGEKYIYD